MTVLSAVLAMTAVVLVLRVPPRGPAASATAARAVPRALVLLALGSVSAALWAWLDAHQFALAMLLGLVVMAVVRLLRRRRAARAADRTGDQVLALCESMASDLAAGQPPLAALDRAAQEWPEFARVAVAGQMGADVPGQLRELARRPGARELRTLAATWQVAHETGSGLASAIGQAAEAIRGERRTARLVAAELASAHATARMLAVLPVGVLLLGAGIGGDPVGFLTGSTAGLVCLGAGLGLSYAGLLWLERIADHVLRR
jgi:tight adherence protein B